MNSMERVVKTLNHQEADRIPVYPIISGASRRLINQATRTGRMTQIFVPELY